MNYDPRYNTSRPPLDKKALELLSTHQVRLYNRGLQAQTAANGFIEADHRLSSILPPAAGLFAPFTGYAFPELEEYFNYIEDLQNNEGPMAMMLRKLARIQDLKDSSDHGVWVGRNAAQTSKLISHTSPKSYSSMESLSKAFEPYLDYSINGEINLRMVSPESQPAEGNTSYNNAPILESAEEMLASKDQFRTSAHGWRVVLNCHEVGGSVSKMLFEGGTMNSIQYRGACVYNNLEEDYYLSDRHHLTQEELEHQLRLLFTRCGWTHEAYLSTSFTPEELAKEIQSMATLWTPVNFSSEELQAIPISERNDYEYRDRLSGGRDEHSVPASLAALEYSHPQRYMEWVTNLSKQCPPGLENPDAPESFFQDQHHFLGHWQINGSNTVYVRGCFDTGEIELSRNRKFEEERHDKHPIVLTNSSRYVLAQWLRTCRKNYLDEVLYWFRRVKTDPPSYLLDAKAAYNPEPVHD